MIPVDHFHDNGDGTALLASDHSGVDIRRLDRPCDLCDPHAWVPSKPDLPCGDCDGGRHTFEIVVAGAWGDPPTPHEVHRVHVIDVLPIVDEFRVLPNSMVVQQHGDRWMVDDPEGERRRITLPSAAEPGMWLVRLAVHS